MVCGGYVLCGCCGLLIVLVRFDRISVVFVVARFRVCVGYVLFGLTDCCLFVFTVVCCLGCFVFIFALMPVVMLIGAGCFELVFTLMFLGLY